MDDTPHRELKQQRVDLVASTTAVAGINNFAMALLERGDIVEARGIHGKTREAKTILYCQAHELPGHAARLLKENNGGWNIYVSINPRRTLARGDDNVLLARCLVADSDGTSIEHAIEASGTAGMPPPTLAVITGHGAHLYWRLMKALAPQFWKEWQQDLAAMLGSDPKICNPERVMRLPGFRNVKAEPIPCEIFDCDPSRVYDLPDLPIPMRPGSDTPAPVFTVRRVIDPGNAGDRVERCRRYLSKCPRAIAGQQGHRITWHAANCCNRFGLTRDEALAVMLDYSATHCDPPWSEKEIRHKVDDAYRRNAHQHGDMLRRSPQERRSVFTVRERGAAA